MFFADLPKLDLIARILLLAPLGLTIVIVGTRLIGLRSFSKMTAFDFVTTIAIGSLLANAAVATKWPVFIQSSGAIIAILSFQCLLAVLRRKSEGFANLISNTPVLLMENGVWNDAAMRKTRTKRSDIWGKMREANVYNLDQVRAIILEDTGDVSVIHADALDDDILTGVIRMGPKSI